MALTLLFIAYLLRKERRAPAVTAEVPVEVETGIQPPATEIQPPSSEPIS